MNAEQIEQIIASAVPGGLKGSLYSLNKANGYKGKLLWACTFTEAEIKEARKIPYPMARAYLFWLETFGEGENKISRPFLENYHNRNGWGIEGSAPYILQLLQEAEALRAQVAEQAAEIEWLKAELNDACGKAGAADRAFELLTVVAGAASDNLNGRIKQARATLAPALSAARGVAALPLDPAQTLAAAIVAAAEALGVQDGE